jgi:ABC-2 type transport system permease protein
MSLFYDTYVIWYREMLRYKRNKYYLLAQVLFPLILIMGIGFGLNNLITLPGKNLNYIDFLSSGILVFTVATGALNGGFNLIEERKDGFLKVVIVAPVSRYAIILGKIAARATFSAIQITLFLAVLSLFVDISFGMFWLVLLTVLFIAAVFVCLGVVLVSLVMDMERYRMITGFIMLPIYFLSGVFFPITALPAALQFVARINPLTYAVDLFRYATQGANEFSPRTDTILLTLLTIVLFVLATRLFDRKFRE